MLIPLTSWLLFAVAGAFAGFLAGLLGIGGGMIIVPALIFSFHAQGVTPEVLTHLAVGTSLATIVMTSVSSVRTHHRKGGVDWSLLTRLAPALMVGSLIGARIAHALPARTLQIVIGIFAIYTGLQMLRARPRGDDAVPQLPGTPALVGGGLGIGAASAVFGIGGGSLMVPYLTRFGVPMQRAVGTAAACGFPIALAGSLGFMVSGWGAPGLPAGSTGYLYWPALAGIAVTSMFFAHLGAVAAHRLPAAQLKRAFAILLTIVGLRFLAGL